jgi:high-affinity iron transporter
MLNAFIIVWRESLEALLIIGVLQVWTARQPDAQALRRSIWAGVAGGVMLAAALGAAMITAGGLLGDVGFDVFQAGMAVAAALLIVQMLWWMRRHAASLREALVASASDASGRWGLAGVAALAVAREGSETAIFLAGAGAGAGAAATLAGGLAGLAAAMATSWLLARGTRGLNPRTVFRIAEVALLLVASAMLAHAVDRLVSIDWLPTGPDPLWDVSGWLPDTQGAGRVLADLAGYRARPSGMLAAIVAAFWCGALWMLRTARREAR